MHCVWCFASEIDTICEWKLENRSPLSPVICIWCSQHEAHSIPNALTHGQWTLFWRKINFQINNNATRPSFFSLSIIHSFFSGIATHEYCTYMNRTDEHTQKILSIIFTWSDAGGVSVCVEQFLTCDWFMTFYLRAKLNIKLHIAASS